MKKKNRFLQKRYLSTFLVAAFLIISVLTAYNIKIGKTKESVENETKETLNQEDSSHSSGVGGRTKQEQKESKSTNKEEEDAGSSNVNGGNTKGNNDLDDSDETRDSKEEDSSKTDNSNDTDNSDTDSSDDTNNNSNGAGYSGREDAGSEYSYDGKTRLSWPVLGNIILPYSMDKTTYYTTLDQYACNDGVLIGGKVGDTVKASADGVIANIIDSDRYGTCVIVLIGNYYEQYYAQIDHVDHKIGDDIKEGEVLGTIAKPTQSFVLEGPHLFFKMTYKGDAINPVKYLKS